MCSKTFVTNVLPIIFDFSPYFLIFKKIKSITQILQLKLRVYFTGENLFTISNTPEGFDPELDDPYKYPMQRACSFGLNLTF